MQYFLMILYAVVANVGLVIMKIGTSKINSDSFLNGILNFPFITGFLMSVISFGLYIYLIAKLNLTYVIPMTSALSFLIIFFTSILILKEQISLLQGIGFFTILLGIILLNLK